MPVHLIAGLRELASRYEGFILDLWGVIHDGVAPIPGAIDCLRSLIDEGKRIVLLSNAPRRAEDVVRRITEVGVPVGLYHQVMSSARRLGNISASATMRFMRRWAGDACTSARSATWRSERGWTSNMSMARGS